MQKVVMHLVFNGEGLKKVLVYDAAGLPLAVVPCVIYEDEQTGQEPHGWETMLSDILVKSGYLLGPEVPTKSGQHIYTGARV